MKNIFELSEEEKNRIRGLHESFKNTQGGLIKEQDEDNPLADDKKETTEVIKGCTDNAATNYNDKATEDDGSCEYPEGELGGTGLKDDEEERDDSKDKTPAKYDRQDPQIYKKLQSQLKAVYDKAFLGKTIALYKGKKAAAQDRDIKVMGIKVGGMKEAVKVKNTSPKILFNNKKEMEGMEIPTDQGTMKYMFVFTPNQSKDNRVSLDGKKRFFSAGLGKVLDKLEGVIEKMNKIRVAKPKTDY